VVPAVVPSVRVDVQSLLSLFLHVAPSVKLADTPAGRGVNTSSSTPRFDPLPFIETEMPYVAD
jgi:hypothetical protein